MSTLTSEATSSYVAALTLTDCEIHDRIEDRGARLTYFNAHEADYAATLACMRDREALDAAEAAFTHDDEVTGGRPVRSYRRLHQGYMAFRELAL
jgi:hypothetical protein